MRLRDAVEYCIEPIFTEDGEFTDFSPSEAIEEYLRGLERDEDERRESR